jgi:hypothetical protein
MSGNNCNRESPLSVESYIEVSKEGARAYREFLKTGVMPKNPYKPRKQREAHEVWAVCFQDARTQHEGDDFVVLGVPRVIIRRNVINKE